MKTLDFLKSQLKNSNLSHAYFIEGVLDVEKIIRLLNVSQPVLLIFQEKPLKINRIRELIHWFALKPHSSLYKIAIILDVEAMTLEAGNALLKILEEPPAHSIIILQSGKRHRILPTVLSRCQLIREKKSPPESIDGYLDPTALAKKSLKDRFDWVQTIVESENLAEILNLWESYFRDHLHQEKDVLQILGKISRARDLLFTNSSVKLLLENLLLDFSK